MSCSIPDDLRFHIGHLWMRPSERSDLVLVGISDFAQKQLGKIIFVDMPRVGDAIEMGEPFGAVESNKVVSELIAPVSGEIVEVNSLLKQSAGLLNEDCYGTAWIAKVSLAGGADLSGLLTSDQYAARLGEKAR